ncbi:NAD-dependent epimerase/dehydratase family protein [Streptomyces sp. NPDC056708]|uniref:NAD-dependent epimerase/dehydratase family protein n=1 Tax=unclassified Streptomyces TaxID=2593676 RepID=UPI0036B13488
MIPWDDVLVTGAAGFIGRHTVAAFHRAGRRVTAVGLRPAPCHLAGAARWRRGDFADEALLSEIATGRYTVVVHQAGISDTRAPAGPELEETNTAGPLRLADACRTGAARLIYASPNQELLRLPSRLPQCHLVEEWLFSDRVRGLLLRSPCRRAGCTS